MLEYGFACGLIICDLLAPPFAPPNSAPGCHCDWPNVTPGAAKDWTKPCLLQITTEGTDPEVVLVFRTLGGNVAASINWNCADPPAGLPEAVLERIKSSGFECPFKPLRKRNLRLLKPHGGQVDVSLDAAPLAEQLASSNASPVRVWWRYRR